MQSALVFALFALGASLAQDLSAGPQTRETQWITRIYAQSPVDVVLMEEALEFGERLLGDGGVSVSWIDCSGPRGADRCGEPLGRNELVLRLLPEGARDGALGEALAPEGQGRIGRYATVFTLGVAELATQSRTPGASLLGATIAHEIGHLLLGQRSHSGRGLMRAIWTVWDLRKIESGRLRFAPEQRRRLAEATARMCSSPRDESGIAADSRAD